MIITRIWSVQPGKFFCLSTKDGKGKWDDHFFTRSQFRDVPQFLKDHADKQIYFCPHGFSRARRIKPYAVLPKLLWSDLDESDPRTLKYKPTIAIESSPGRFVGLWFTDSEVTEELNRRMSYAVGADKSGWDLTQVLRVPGTVNYKYHSMPRVKILWTDGPEFKMADLNKRLPSLEDDTTGVDESDAAAVFKQYEKVMPHWCRREVLNGKPTAGKRSEMFWKLGQTLVECGLSTEEVFVLLKASPWNKFAGRRNEDLQLQREIDKALNKHLQASKPAQRERRNIHDEDPAGESDDDRKLIFRSMDEVEEENIDWIWYPYIARGELSILEGDPGLGKSYLMQVIAKHICDGLPLPSDNKHNNAVVRGKVCYFDMENSAGTVTKKRLTTNGLKNLKDFVQCEEPFSIDDEDALDEVYDYVEASRPSLVVFDTINTYMGKTDAFKGHEVQQAFAKFREIAKRFNCAVVVLRHLTKSTKEKALYRGQGSISFAGLARVVMTVGVVPEEPDIRAMAITKINVARPPRALTFTIESLPDSGKDRDRSRFVWGDFQDFMADDLLAAPSKSNNSEKEDATAFLEAQLDEGPLELDKLERMAEKRSIGKRALEKAAEGLGVVKQSKGFGKAKRMFWSLPGAVDEEV